MNPEFLRIAQAARKEMKAFARIHPGAGHPGDLEGYCGISSHFLRNLAGMFGYRLDLVSGCAFDTYYEKADSFNSNHCWNLIDRHVVDITATQFRKSAKVVHIVKEGNINYLPWKKSKTNDRKAVSSFFSGWIDEQSPKTYFDELAERADRLMLELQQAA